MPLPTAKELKALAKACREAGISHLKGDGFEFTLSDLPPPAPKPRGKAAAKAKANHDDGKDVDTKEVQLSEDELLFWSASGGMPVPMSPDSVGGSG